MHPKLNPIDKSVTEALASIAEKHPELVARFGAISAIQPTSPAVMPGAVGWAQAPLVLGLLAPDVVAGRDRRLSHIEVGDEAMVIANDVVGFNDEVRQTERGMKLVQEEVEPHAWATPLDNDEVAIANSNGINIVALKSGLPRQVVETGKEVNGAAFFAATGSYASSSHYQTLQAGEKISDPNSDPLKLFSDWIEFVRTRCGLRADTMGFGPSVMNTLAWHPKVLELLKNANVLGRGIPVTAQIVAQLLNVNVVIGEGTYKASVSATPTDIWGDNVYILHVGDAARADLVQPRFAITAVSPDYPQVIPMPSTKGVRGGQEIRYADVYKTYSLKKTAGAALFDCL